MELYWNCIAIKTTKNDLVFEFEKNEFFCVIMIQFLMLSRCYLIKRIKYLTK